MNLNLSFSAQVDAWAKETEQRLEKIRKAATQELGSVASNNVPIDLGFAQASFMASTEEMPQIDPSATNKKKLPVRQDFNQVVAVIANSSPGQTVYMGWTAAYILPLEYGHSQQAPQGFARLAAIQWPAIVSSTVAKAKARVG